MFSATCELSVFSFLVSATPYSFFLFQGAKNWLFFFLYLKKIKPKSSEGVKVSHLLFADDTSIFCEAS